jgi:hypothetical protein
VEPETWRIIISVRSAEAMPASSVAVLRPCGSPEVSVQPAMPADPAPCGCASPITITNLRVSARQLRPDGV